MISASKAAAEATVSCLKLLRDHADVYEREAQRLDEDIRASSAKGMRLLWFCTECPDDKVAEALVWALRQDLYQLGYTVRVQGFGLEVEW